MRKMRLKEDDDMSSKSPRNNGWSRDLAPEPAVLPSLLDCPQSQVSGGDGKPGDDSEETFVKVLTVQGIVSVRIEKLKVFQQGLHISHGE